VRDRKEMEEGGKERERDAASPVGEGARGGDYVERERG
jgi:hypothetical protein